MSNRPSSARKDNFEDVLRDIDSAGDRIALRKIPSQPRPQPAVVRDSLANEEEQRFEAGDYLEEEARRSKHRRGESAKGAFHWLKLCTLWFGWGMFAILNVAWLFHVVTPWRWLSPDEIAVIQNVIVALWAGKIGMFLERYAKKHSDEDE